MSVLMQGKDGKLVKVAGSSGLNTPVITVDQLTNTLGGSPLVVKYSPKEEDHKFIPLDTTTGGE